VLDTQTFAGKVAVVTGAGSGIGRASALGFARGGASVAVVDTNVDTGRETVALIETEVPGSGHFFACDVTDEGEVANLIANVTSTLGRLDAAHNNAGISPLTGGVVECTRELWDRIIAVNLTGVWLGMKYEIPAILQTAGRGAIVNTSSGAGITGVAGLPAYVASKHGVAGVTKSAALEYATKGIRVNAVCPGTTLTEFLREKVDAGFYSVEGMAANCPMKRLADPSEIAAAAVWLCSDNASFVTGVVMPVDGATVAGPAALG
jgi:NAD(P)-dependent dehydrogenase (short-subunit alcohol dehydrogenase family)